MQIKHDESQATITDLLASANLKGAQANALHAGNTIKELTVHKDAMIAGMNNETKVQVAKIGADAKAKSGDTNGGANNSD